MLLRELQLYYGICIVLVIAPVLVFGHGRLISPPGRSSVWRFTDNPLIKPYESQVVPNYNDNELFCGGFQHQVSQGGKCGVCGDPFDGRRENEAGGKYAQGIIVAQYAIGETIAVRVDLTASHKGYFEFRICPVNDPTNAATHDCLNSNLLTFTATGQTRYYLPEGAPSKKVYELLVKLPDNLECSQCVMQWHYHTGNSWGVGPDGVGCIGCGAQEEFYGCADVAIGDDMITPPSIPSVTTTTRKSPAATTTRKTTTTTTESNVVKCKEGEFSPRDCYSYYWCVHSQWIVNDCPAGLVVGQNGIPPCDWVYNVISPCGIKTI